MDTFTSLRIFRQVVDSSSFIRAAELLDMSTAMVSKHITRIEQRLGGPCATAGTPRSRNEGNRNSLHASCNESMRALGHICAGVTELRVKSGASVTGM